jgi:pyruvate dehydrogenase E2 component (dihydrolipoamide acetyltransferase)
MATEVIMPQMGESIFEGTITKWLKKVGESVAKDEPLFEISTDKVDAEIPSPVAGVLTEIKVDEGATVQINTVVAIVGEAGEPAKPTPAANGTETAPAAKQEAGDGASEKADKGAAAKAAPDAAGPGSKAASEPPSKPTPAAKTGETSGGTEVVMPQMGESIFEGTITKWLKKTGDSVAKDEPLFEISTDKVDAEIPAPVAGVVTVIKVPEGSTVQINTVVAVIGGSQDGAGSASPSSDTVAGPDGQATESPAPEGSAAAPSVETPADAGPSAAGKLRSSPLVRRIARDHELDLKQIPGTGSGGRITKDDALRFLAEKGPGTAAASAAPLAPAPTPAPAVAAASSVPAAATRAPAPASVPAGTPGELVPLSKMRGIIAQRMVESTRISPHVHTVFNVDMTRIVRLREREKTKFEQRNGVKLTYMPFIASAAIQTLRKFPVVNASLESTSSGDAIRYHRNIHLGIAVALDWGLIVPVIQRAEERSFLGLARAVADLAERARGKKLKPDEASGSTFTLTNSGIFGEEFGTPIINQPESAILAIGGLKKEAVVLTDADGSDTVAIRSMQHFCLGFDHRTIDGADAGRFMAEFKKTLEGWSEDIG